MMAGDQLITLEQYEVLPESDYYIEELSRGVLVREPRPGDEHGAIVPRIIIRLGAYLSAHPEVGELRSESGFLLSTQPATVRGPDVAVVLAKNLPLIKPRSFFVGAPDIAIEVISPGNTASDIQRKVLEFIEAGTAVVWVVYPATATVVEHLSDGSITLLNGGDILETPLMPGFALRVSELFH